MKRLMYVAPLLAIGLVGCGSGKGTPTAAAPTAASVPAPVIAVVVSPSMVSSSTSPSATPISVYAAQYTRLTAAGNAAYAQLHSLPDDATNAQVQAVADKVLKAEQATDAALLRAAWPADIEADIRALVTADGPVFGDLNDVVDGADKMSTDSAVANAAANILHADLGLPPVS